MSFVEAEFEDTGVVVCRTGYTGERGYELIALNEVAGGAVGPAARGRASRSGCCRAGSAPATRCAPRWATRCTGRTSRIDVTPNQAGLGWAVGWKKDAFWGRDALVAEKEAGPKRMLRGLVAARARHPAPGHDA